MSNPFTDGSLQREARPKTAYIGNTPVDPWTALEKAGATIGDLVTISWKVGEGDETAVESIMAKISDITNDTIHFVIRGKDAGSVPIRSLLRARVERKITPEELAQHEALLKEIEEEAEQVPAFDDWDESQADFDQRIYDEQQAELDEEPSVNPFMQQANPNPFLGL